jgi:Predicted membrane protein (DUF2339)
MELLTLAILVFCIVLWSLLTALRNEMKVLRARLEHLEAQQVRRREKVAPDSPVNDGALLTAEDEPAERSATPTAAFSAAEQGLWKSGPLAGPPGNAQPAVQQAFVQPVVEGTAPQSPFTPSIPDSSPPRRPMSSRTIFALLGAAVTLGGAAWFMAALARSGVLTRELQLGLAALLGVALYALAHRPSRIIGEAMRGLGYAVLALCVGALVGADVAPPGAALTGILLLSVLVGVHGVRQGRLLGTATALSGASLSTWILADNLGGPLTAQLCLLGILACTVYAEGRLKSPASALLALLPAVSVLGLVVTAGLHEQLGTPPMWAALLLGAAGSALTIGLKSIGLKSESRGSPVSDRARPAPRLPARNVLGATGILLAGLAGAAPLLQPYLDGSGIRQNLSTLTLLLVGGVMAGAALWLQRRSPQPLLRDALLGVGVGTLGAALALGIDGLRLSSRLLGLASATALTGSWMGSVPWRRIGAAGLLLVLLDHLVDPWPSSGVVALLVLGTAAALAGRSGALLAGVSGAVLGLGLSTLLRPSSVLGFSVPFVFAVLAVALLYGASRLLSRSQPTRAATLAWATTGAGLMLLPLSQILGGQPYQAALQGLIAGAVLYLALGARQIVGTPWSGFLSAPRLIVPLELLGVATVTIGLLAWTLRALLDGQSLPPLALLLSLLAVVVATLPGESRWFWRAWPPLGLSALASLVVMLGSPASGAEASLTLLGTAVTLAALWLLITPAGLNLLKLRQSKLQVPPALSAAFIQDAVFPALTLVLLALMGRTLELLIRHSVSGSTELFTFTTAFSVVLLVGAVLLLGQARQQRIPLRWWVALVAFGLAALKLVFIDFGDLGGMARGAATVVIGLLLLGIGQLAPRPESVLPDPVLPATDLSGPQG